MRYQPFMTEIVIPNLNDLRTGIFHLGGIALGLMVGTCVCCILHAVINVIGMIVAIRLSRRFMVLVSCMIDNVFSFRIIILTIKNLYYCHELCCHILYKFATNKNLKFLKKLRYNPLCKVLSYLNLVYFVPSGILGVKISFPNCCPSTSNKQLYKYKY